MLARVIARIHPLLFYAVLLAAFVVLAMVTDRLTPEIRGVTLNAAMTSLGAIWIIAVWLVTLQAYDQAAVFGFSLGPRIALMAAALLSVGGAFIYAGLAVYLMFAWRTAEGLERVAERSTDVSLLEVTEIFVLLAVPPIGIWLLRRRIRRAAQRGQVAEANRKTEAQVKRAAARA